MPPNVLLVDALMNGTYFLFFGFLMVAMDTTLAFLIKSRIENNFYDTVMMRGGTKITYWLSHYLKDFTLYMMPVVVFLLVSEFIGHIPNGMLLIYTQFALVQPLFIYTLVYFFSVVCNKRGVIAMIIIVGFTVTGANIANALGPMR